jgi:CDP-glycerol glycerophosphotransferase (TagB/SpsB family)/glycosyltransferase involved in cell wall biosynthesis
MVIRRMRRTIVRSARRIARAAASEWSAFWQRRPVEQFVVLYESFGGNGANCNPEALYRALLAAPDQQHLQHIWALDRQSMRTIGRDLRSEARTRIVRRGSMGYARRLATAGTLINNATFPPAFARRDGQRYLNTWHGTPLKRMGYDEPDGAHVSANTVRNFLNATHLLAQNSTMTDQMYRGSYRLDGLFTGQVLEVGYPRGDRLRLSTAGEEAARAAMRHGGAHVGDERIVLYAPTWRGERFAAPEDRSVEMADTVEALQARLDAAGISATVLVKPHQIVFDAARREPRLRHRLVPNEIPTNVVLGTAAVLVSDYSSIIVDWLATGRPVVLEVDADAAYESSRGLYVADGWPGPRCVGVDALGTAVISALADGIPTDHADAYRRMAERFVADDDGHASERVIDVLFRGREHRDRVRRLVSDGRPSMLIHLGGMRSNGITSAAVNLLPRLVDAGVDVTVTFPNSVRSANRVNRARIDPRVRQLQRVGGMAGSKWLHYLRRRADRRGLVFAHSAVPALHRLWDDEWRRCFGTARFDAVVDYSAYAPFWAELLLHAPEPTFRSVWLHNDMLAEVDRLVDGRARMRRSLSTMIGLYPQFDRAVSVSPSLSRHNAARLTPVAPANYVAARNLIDAEAVRRAASVPVETVLREEALARTIPTDDDGEPEPWEVPPWVESLVRRPDGTVWFVCVGRLSPEKNHDRLLRAFARVHVAHPEARLLVIGGGSLRERLERLADDLTIASVVVFTGIIGNPFPMMAAADCLVVSSDHEGQPMVILEGAVLGRPVVATDFASVRDALPGDQVHVVPATVPDLAAGMRDFLRGEVSPTHLDTERYNREATAEFLDATLPGISRPTTSPASRTAPPAPSVPSR